MLRVAITGIGIISSLGNSPRQVLDNLRNGRSGVELVPDRKALGFHSALAGTIKDFIPPEMPKSYARQMGDGGRMAVAAAQQAIEDAGLTEDQIRHDRTGVVVGNSGNMRDIYQLDYRKHVLKKKLTGLALPRTMASSISANLTVLLGTRGHTLTISSACASGATAIGHARQIIQLGLQDRVIAGGVQEGSWEYDCLFDALRVFSRREDDPAAASRPFDENRDGLVPAAGAGFVVVERYDQAAARGAKVYAEVIGYATNSDGEKMTTPSGSGSVRCMEMALADTGLAPEQIDYISAHATGTPVGDAAEAQGIAQVFGDRPYVSSTKSMTGHEVAAAGSSELIYTLLMMEHGFVAPSINIDEVSEDCRGAHIVANEAIDAEIRVAMSNSFGFGGVNAVLIVKRPE